MNTVLQLYVYHGTAVVCTSNKSYIVPIVPYIPRYWHPLPIKIGFYIYILVTACSSDSTNLVCTQLYPVSRDQEQFKIASPSERSKFSLPLCVCVLNLVTHVPRTGMHDVCTHTACCARSRYPDKSTSIFIVSNKNIILEYFTVVLAIPRSTAAAVSCVCVHTHTCLGTSVLHRVAHTHTVSQML